MLQDLAVPIVCNKLWVYYFYIYLYCCLYVY